ncbi:helix-turn-helix domain-containing protein [Cyclobacterium qasimii]|uniref:HTH cro/C1-type domain-containing protein n=2 Tax=Cyclobacterium qasimii TaxID=1350429 RepID=S7WQX7_9BACT|nr:helix-turn-helix transcriptional regulator [Cyclobacterium qasimii]EPR66528.1 hypothetical protein ADICYQ_4440 [Cyclobacterium qasimii M12-11B]GEO23472.1 hypothetical protein CQA01_40060 [Cyclobacterium qasimii]
MSFFGRNIKKIRSLKLLSQQAFAEVFDLKRATLGAYEEERSEPKIDTIIKIANYFSIPIDDLLTKELTINQLLKFNTNLTTDAGRMEVTVLTKVPIILPEYVGDYLNHHSKKNFIADLPVMSLPINNEKIFRAYTITDLEMANQDVGFYPNDVVVGELVPKSAYKKLNNRTPVFVITDTDILVRRFITTDKGFVLRADHKGIDDQIFNAKQIHELWRIRYVFYKRIPETSGEISDQINLLRMEIEKLKK